MNNEPKKKNERPSSHYQEEMPEGKVPSGNKVVKQPEDTDYDAKDPDFKDMPKRKETDEQPVNSIKTPPTKP